MVNAIDVDLRRDDDPGTIFVSLMLALILNSGLFGKAFFVPHSSYPTC